MYNVTPVGSVWPGNLEWPGKLTKHGRLAWRAHSSLYQLDRPGASWTFFFLGSQLYTSYFSVGEDTFFGEYFVPKGTVVMRNVWAVHMSSTLWKNPEEFEPSRFLSRDGSRLLNRPRYLIPFSVGKCGVEGQYYFCISYRYQLRNRYWFQYYFIYC